MNDVRCTFCDTMNARTQRHCVSCGAELPGGQALEIPLEGASLEDQILRIARDSGKIDAIKHYREVTGAGLAEAKDAVEALMAGGTTTPSGPTSSADQEVLTIVRNQGKIAAIKRYRDLTGCGLREAKSAVEGLMAKTGTQAPSGAGCSTTAVVALCLLVALTIRLMW